MCRISYESTILLENERIGFDVCNTKENVFNILLEQMRRNQLLCIKVKKNTANSYVLKIEQCLENTKAIFI